MVKRLRRRILAIGLVLILLIVGGCLFWLKTETAPTPTGQPFYVRYERPMPLLEVLQDLKTRGVVRNPQAFKYIALFRKASQTVAVGTYQLHGGMSASAILKAIAEPIRQMVRIPETNWALRTSRLLETKYHVCKSDEYMALVRQPQEFAKEISFPLPKDSLEGYLYPDTYDLPPLIGARAVILRQLKAFQTRVWEGLNHPKNLPMLLTEASMVQLESGAGDERNIAGVIVNRLEKHMRLQIDATILYGIQKWRRLTYADYKNLDTPYNTYLYDGLPPGPICSPTVTCIEAALNPAHHNFVYYVALPHGKTIFASTYAQHLKNIERMKEARKEAQEDTQ